MKSRWSHLSSFDFPLREQYKRRDISLALSPCEYVKAVDTTTWVLGFP